MSDRDRLERLIGIAGMLNGKRKRQIPEVSLERFGSRAPVSAPHLLANNGLPICISETLDLTRRNRPVEQGRPPGTGQARGGACAGTGCKAHGSPQTAATYFTAIGARPHPVHKLRPSFVRLVDPPPVIV
jgi:hypothetical protein